MSDYMKELINGGQSLDEIQKAALNEAFSSVALEAVEKKERWEPKEWRPEYQLVVILSTMNYSGEQIVDIMERKYNYSITKQHVSNILNCSKAKDIKKEVLTTVEERTKKTVEQNLELMEQLASDRVVELLQDNALMKSHPFAMIDRSIKILEGRQKLRNSINDAARGIQNQQNNFYSLPPEIQARIDSGLNKANEVHQLHGSKYNTPESGDGEVKRSGTDG